MRLTILSFLIVFIKLCFSDDSLVVPTTLGKIKGHYRITAKNVKYKAYEGIPYALPPLQDNRFLPPEPAKAWQGVLLANSTRKKCWGYDSGKIKLGDEDCLYLNVYAPVKKSTNKNLPVIVYIHGGGFQFSTLNGAEQNNFMDQNVIFVVLNYRLGILGFLSTEDDVVSGNMGLKDQAMALKWIKEHVKSFDGDSSKITIVGCSTAGASVHYHYLSPMSKGLFNSGISMSGTALMPTAQAKNSREKALKLGKLMNCDTTDVRRMVQCLRHKTALSLLETQGNFTGWREHEFVPFGPVVEKSKKNTFINRSPIEIINSGDAQKLPWITSTVSEEGLVPLLMFITNNTVLKELDKNWESLAPRLLLYYNTLPKSEHSKIATKIRQYYFGNMPINKENFLNLTHLVGDRYYAADSVKAAKLQSRVNRNSSVWYYHFTYRPIWSVSEKFTHSKENFGTSHADDLLLTYRELGVSNREKNDLKMQKKLINLWVSMAYNGKPNSNLNWRSLNTHTADFEYLKISGPENIKMVNNNKLANNQFWNSINFKENILH